MIIHPVARTLAVADVARSVAFYRDVLGFDERPSEVVCGPAQIEFTTGEPRRSVVFCQSDDVEALHAAVAARGGNPTALENVNGIKMRVFEVRDPDGHALWFGQSFDRPVPPAPPPNLERALPILPLDDVAAGVAYYRDVLGFRINYQQHDLGVMDRDDITVLLAARTERHKGIGSMYVYVRDVDALYAELRAKGANVQGEPVSHPWGLRDFGIVDPEENEVRFGQPFE
jgi:predicted enzyme related to lactoylglutathione lyase